MDIGTLIARLAREEDAGEALQALGDITLYARALAMGERFGESPATYTASAVARFASFASDADWIGLVGALERTGFPGQTFLQRVLDWSLTRDAGESSGHQCVEANNHAEFPDLEHGNVR